MVAARCLAHLAEARAGHAHISGCRGGHAANRRPSGAGQSAPKPWDRRPHFAAAVGQCAGGFGTGGRFAWPGALRSYAPNLSNMRALACISRIRYLDLKTPSEPRFEPVSVKRASLSEPEKAECKSTGGGCHEWPFIGQGVE